MAVNPAPTTVTGGRGPMPLPGAGAEAQAVAMFVGRILLSAVFLWGAAGTLADWSAAVRMLADKHIQPAPLLLAGATALELLGGLSLLFGLWARGGAVLLILFLVPVTIIMHNFWALEGHDQQLQLINFMKNVAILGGLFLVLAVGSGRYSTDHCCK